MKTKTSFPSFRGFFLRPVITDQFYDILISKYTLLFILDPPRTCAAALKKKKKYGVSYTQSGPFLISPKPYDPEIKPFMAHCDFDMVKGKGVTVIYPHKHEGAAEPVVDPVTGEILDAQKDKNKVEGGDGKDGKVEFTYHAPTEAQIRALVSASKYCYQTVRFECQNSPVSYKIDCVVMGRSSSRCLVLNLCAYVIMHLP